MLSDRMEVAKRIAESFKSDLKAFIFDKTLVDSRVVETIIHLSGFDNYIESQGRGNIVAHYISTRKIRRMCLYGDCANASNEEVGRCLADCMARIIESISSDIADTVLEVAKNMKP